MGAWSIDHHVVATPLWSRLMDPNQGHGTYTSKQLDAPGAGDVSPWTNWIEKAMECPIFLGANWFLYSTNGWTTEGVSSSGFWSAMDSA